MLITGITAYMAITKVIAMTTIIQSKFQKIQGKILKVSILKFLAIKIFITGLIAFVCIPEILTQLLTPILPYLVMTNVKCRIWQYGCQKIRQDLRNADQCH